MAAFYVVVLLAVVAAVILLAKLYRPVGRFIMSIFDDVQNAISDDEEDTNEEKKE